MTPQFEKLATAAQDARYIFAVYVQFGKPVPEALLSKVCDDLVEGLEDYRAATGSNLPPRKTLPELEKFDRGLGSWMDTVEWAGQ